VAFDHYALAGSKAFGDDDLVLVGVKGLNPADFDDTACLGNEDMRATGARL
jgi:hypothetical protein